MAFQNLFCTLADNAVGTIGKTSSCRGKVTLTSLEINICTDPATRTTAKGSIDIRYKLSDDKVPTIYLDIPTGWNVERRA